MSNALSAQNLTIRYSSEGDSAVSDLAINIARGEFVGVVGPNGCGKSTLVRALSRTLKPVGGAVLLDGRNLYSLSARESAQTIGVVPQSTSVGFDFTVRDIVDMGRSPRLPSRPFASFTENDAEAVSKAMRETSIQHLRDRIANTLSGGELQRVLIARALAQEPDVLLLDEPTAHLDIQHQLEILELARRLAHRDNLAVLAVLHDLNLAAAYCDRLVLMKSGKVISSGRPAEVLTAQNVMDVYGARVWMRLHPTSGRPYIVTLPESELPSAQPQSPNGPHIHIVCGGGTGAGAMILLGHSGCRLTAGPLNSGDSDQEAAASLGIECAQEAPFTAVSESVLAEAEAFAAAADAVLVTDVPFGRGNVASLQMVLRRLRAGQAGWLMEPTSSAIAERDFTDGVASSLWTQLLDEGAVRLSGLDDLAARADNREEKSIEHRS